MTALADAARPASPLRVGEDLSDLATRLRAWLQAHPVSTTSAAGAVRKVLDLVDSAALRRYVKGHGTR
ncbi:hypothetical protein [Streptomyces sp. NPDC057636]|uniref:hypothetical protein n=1 Tax=Streptomyces sp. NPDC057636 TaxID=3346189 RepID=UPI0036B0FB6E